MYLMLLGIMMILLSRIVMGSDRIIVKASIALCFYISGLLTSMLTEREVPILKAGERVIVKGARVSDAAIRNGYCRFEFDATHIVSCDTAYTGKTRLLIYEDSAVVNESGNNPGKVVYSGVIYPIINNGNPGEFDYAGYMALKNCYYRFYPDSMLAISSHSLHKGIRQMALLAKQRITASWEGPGDALSILRAMTLGDKSGLSMEIRQDYADAGGMHILAVSGLHVGLIWWVMGKLFFFLNRFRRGRIIKSLLLIIILWFYACMVGLSPSVCRSVTMFSLVSFSTLLSRKSTTLNSVMLSAFILILLNPNQLDQLGFQLSYLAVCGIIIVQPFLSGLFKTQHRVARWFIDLMSVSVAAQIATAPLSIYYFHQLPAYFMLTNLFAIPILSILMMLFISSLPFFLAGSMEEIVLWPLIKLSQLLNALTAVVADIPGSTLEGLQIQVIQAILVILLICALLMFLKYRIAGFISLSFILLAAILVFSAVQEIHIRQNSMVSVNHFRSSSLVTIVQGFNVTHLCAGDASNGQTYISHYISSTYDGRRYQSEQLNIDTLTCYYTSGLIIVEVFEGCHVVEIHDFRMLILDKKIIPTYKTFYSSCLSDLVIFRNFRTWYTADSLSIYPEADLVADGSNSWYAAQGLFESYPSLHDTGTKGAYIKFVKKGTFNWPI